MSFYMQATATSNRRAKQRPHGEVKEGRTISQILPTSRKEDATRYWRPSGSGVCGVLFIRRERCVDARPALGLGERVPVLEQAEVRDQLPAGQEKRRRKITVSSPG